MLQKVFQLVRIVNLAERTDRKRDTERELRRLGWPAPDPRLAFLDARRPTDKGHFPSTGVRGCYESHLQILREASAHPGCNVLILEDDIQFSDRLAEEASAVESALLGQPWDIVYLGHRVPGRSTGPLVLRPERGDIALTHCYGVHARCIPQLVQFLDLVRSRPGGHPEGGAMHVDGAISTFRSRHPDVVTLVAEPNLAWTRPTASDLDPRWYDHVPVLRALVQGIRLLKPRADPHGR